MNRSKHILPQWTFYTDILEYKMIMNMPCEKLLSPYFNQGDRKLFTGPRHADWSEDVYLCFFFVFFFPQLFSPNSPPHLAPLWKKIHI